MKNKTSIYSFFLINKLYKLTISSYISTQSFMIYQNRTQHSFKSLKSFIFDFDLYFAEISLLIIEIDLLLIF